MVYYRKYRPQTISELDLANVREKLTSMLLAKELPHAFLFTGSKGLGKTSSARILAKAINCTDKTKGFEPCNKCEACVSITNGSNIDVLEIDAASNGGVEEIRNLRERVKFAPSRLKYKVYIIDEVHMLSTGAFNALLKTLEEPPSHVIFILATTELWKLPPTVVSRTFQVEFQKPTEKELMQSLERIVKGEKIDIEKYVLSEIYKMANGSFRDGAKLLEEVVLSSKGKKITKEVLSSTFKTGGLEEHIFSFLKAMEERNLKKGLEIISNLSASGADFKIFIERLTDNLRGLLMLRSGIESEVSDISNLSLKDIKTLLEYLNEAFSELKVSVVAQLPLELMVIKWCVIDSQDAGDSVQETVDKEQGKKTTDNKQPTNNTSPFASIRQPAEKQSKDIEFLKQLLEFVNRDNKPVAALLRSCKSADLDSSKLIISTPFPIHADRLKSEKSLVVIEKAVKSLLGKKIEVQIQVLPN
jgi:DNA polymerase-3 subunit gamma/tau